MLSFRGVSKIDSECGSYRFPSPFTTYCSLLLNDESGGCSCSNSTSFRGIAEDLKLRRRYTMILKHSWNIHQTFDLFNFEWHFNRKDGSLTLGCPPSWLRTDPPFSLIKTELSICHWFDYIYIVHSASCNDSKTPRTSRSPKRFSFFQSSRTSRWNLNIAFKKLMGEHHGNSSA